MNNSNASIIKFDQCYYKTLYMCILDNQACHSECLTFYHKVVEVLHNIIYLYIFMSSRILKIANRPKIYY